MVHRAVSRAFVSAPPSSPAGVPVIPRTRRKRDKAESRYAFAFLTADDRDPLESFETIIRIPGQNYIPSYAFVQLSARRHVLRCFLANTLATTRNLGTEGASS